MCRHVSSRLWQQPWAVVATPDDWKQRHPLAFDAETVQVPVSLAGEAVSTLRTVMFGSAPVHAGADRCTRAVDQRGVAASHNATAMAVAHGRVCIVDTPAPMWSNFSHPNARRSESASVCAGSAGLSAHPTMPGCRGDVHFAMLVRRASNHPAPTPSAAAVRSGGHLASQTGTGQQPGAMSTTVPPTVQPLPSSCVEALRRFPDAPSGHYDIQMPGHMVPTRVYCDMANGGWQLCAVLGLDVDTGVTTTPQGTASPPMMSTWHASLNVAANATPPGWSDILMPSWSLDCSRWLRAGAMVSISNSTTSASPLMHSAVLQSRLRASSPNDGVGSVSWRVDGRSEPLKTSSFHLTPQRMSLLTLGHARSADGASSPATTPGTHPSGLWGQAVSDADACTVAGVVAGQHMCHGALPHSNALEGAGWEGAVAFWVRVAHDDAFAAPTHPAPVPKPHTCFDVWHYSPQQPSGPVALWPEGDDALPVLAECDMETASDTGEVWTIVCTSDDDRGVDSAGAQYRPGLQPIVATASEVRLAVSSSREAHRASASSRWVAFPLPDEWRHASPMATRVATDRGSWPMRSPHAGATQGVLRWGRGAMDDAEQARFAGKEGAVGWSMTAADVCSGAWGAPFNDTSSTAATNTTAVHVVGRVCAVTDVGAGAAWSDVVVGGVEDGVSTSWCGAAGGAEARHGGNMSTCTPHADHHDDAHHAVFSIAVRHAATTVPTAVPPRSDALCPAGWSLLVDSHTCVKAVSSLQSMEATRTLCAPGDLATVGSMGDNDALAAACPTSTCWLGAQSNDANDWWWVDGSEWRFSNFAPHEPSSVVEHCVELRPTDGGTWNDVTCWANKGGVCTLPASPVAQQELPRSCEHVLALHPTATSGAYTVYPLGDVAHGTRVYCDMDTDGGGWSVVLSAHRGDTFAVVPNPALEPSAAVPSSALGARLPRFSPALAALMSGAGNEVLMALRAHDNDNDNDNDDDNDNDNTGGPGAVVAEGAFATFDMPAVWRHRHPFMAAAQDVPVTAQLGANRTQVRSVLRFGHGGVFGTGCDGNWSTGPSFGRICLRGTDAPAWSGFASAGAPSVASCGVHAGSGSPVACEDVWFTLAVRSRDHHDAATAGQVAAAPVSEDLPSTCQEAVVSGSVSGMYTLFPTHQRHAVRRGVGRDTSLPTSCADVLSGWPSAPSGAYTLLPPNLGHAIRVYCDMAHGGAMLCGTVGMAQATSVSHVPLGLSSSGDGSSARGRRTPGYSVDCRWALTRGARVALTTSPTDSQTHGGHVATLVSDASVEMGANVTEGVFVAPVYRCVSCSQQRGALLQLSCDPGSSCAVRSVCWV